MVGTQCGCIAVISTLLVSVCGGPQDGPDVRRGEARAETRPPHREPIPDAGRPDATAPAQTGRRVWSFDGDTAGSAPAGFTSGRTGHGALGQWVVRPASDAPSAPNVLAQINADATDDRYPIAVADAPVLRDLRLSVRCKPVSGRVDRACGLVFREQDVNAYLLVRANALEDNVRLYVVSGGRRRQIATADAHVAAGTWHELAIEAEGEQIRVRWNGGQVIDHRDATLLDAGRVGVWTKADSLTEFDDLTVEPLAPGAAGR